MDMSSERAQSGLINGRTGLVAMVASCCLILAGLFGASSAKAATPGQPVDVDFNYVGINVTAAALGGFNDLVLTPETLGEDSQPLGALELRGQYTSSSGDFVVPKTGGLVFPDLDIDIEGVVLTGEIGLVEDATGNYNEATGDMSFNPKISLTLGVSDVAALPLPGLGSGPLACKLEPLDVDFSTANGWPAAGNTFEPGFVNGAVAGAWTIKPNITAVNGLQSTCDLIGAVLEPVGGLWLAQSETPITELPAATSPKPAPAVCPEGSTGTPPNCVADPIDPPIDPPIVDPEPGKVSIKGKPKAVKIKRGKRGTVRVKVRNTGEQAASGVKVCGKISKKIAKKPKCVNLRTIAAGETKTAKIKLKVKKKAKGKTKLKIRVNSKGAGSAKAKATVKVKK